MTTFPWSAEFVAEATLDSVLDHVGSEASRWRQWCTCGLVGPCHILLVAVRGSVMHRHIAKTSFGGVAPDVIVSVETPESVIAAARKARYSRDSFRATLECPCAAESAVVVGFVGGDMITTMLDPKSFFVVRDPKRAN